VSKIDPSLKTPKCHLNDQNRHFVNSEPPGPAFFEFQGVPRDPVLRPKSDPLFLNVKSDTRFSFFTFFTFYILHILMIFTFLWFAHFDDFSVLVHFWLKALLQYRREDGIMCGGSPLSEANSIFVFLLLVKNVGEITQGRVNIFYSRSPLSEPEFVSFGFNVFLLIQMSGRYTG